MFRYVQSAAKAMRRWFTPPQRRPIRSNNTLPRPRVEQLEDRVVPASLNTIIDSVLEARYLANQSFPATFTHHIDSATVGATLQNGVDLTVEDADLTFIGVTGSPGNWAGEVKVEATSGVLLDGLMDIQIEDGDDQGDFAVTGVINLAGGTATALNFDDIDAEEIGVPSFLDVQFTELWLNFTNFRGAENSNTLHAKIQFTGFDTGVEELNELMASDNPFFQLTLEGTKSVDLNLTSIENTVATSGAIDIETAFHQELLAEAGSQIEQGQAFNIFGKIFHVGEIEGTASYKKISVDADGDGTAELTSGYLAVKGGFQVADEELGGRGRKFDIAFAISDLGPLQFFISMSPEEGDSPKAQPAGSIKVESARFGVIFNKTIEQLQSGIDYQATAAVVGAKSGDTYPVTLTIPDHDLEEGDSFAIVAPKNSKYVGEYEVVEVNGDQVTVHMDQDPGTFSGPVSVIRRTIKDPLDLRDDGLQTGISIPGSIIDWDNQLEGSVRELLVAGDNVWRTMFEDVVIGGGATLSISDIPDTVLLMDVDMMLDTHLRIMLKGNMILADGIVQAPATLYADLSELLDLEARFLFLADVGQVPLVDDPLLVLRGEATFEAVKQAGQVIGFRIGLEGGVDLNIPEATTLTLEGGASLAFTSPPAGPEELRIDLGFGDVVPVRLSETNFGDIASASGAFTMAIDVANPDPLHPKQGFAEIWGAARLSTDFAFLHNVGLFPSASAVLRVNSSASEKQVTLQGQTLVLPAESFALRLDGSADFRIDFNGDHTFAPKESVASLQGTFLLEISADGFNAALFDESDSKGRATIAIGPSDSRFLEFGVRGFLAIRGDGIAADLVLTADADLPLELAKLHAAAVFVVNTTGDVVTFDIPAGVDPDRTGGLTLTIPEAAPRNPGSILKAPGKDVTDLGLDALIDASPSWDKAAAGPYGVVFVAGDLNFLSVLDLDVSGYFLLSKDVVSLNANFYAGGDFLNLVEASVSGSLFFSSQGEFELLAKGSVQLGPEGFNIHGSADLTISYLDSDGKGSAGTGSKKLAVTGNLNVGATVFYVDMGQLTLGVSYKEPDITVSLTVPVPDIAWTEPDPLFGVSWPYPTIVNKPYSFTVGTLTVNPVPPPPIFLASRGTDGVLTLNVGPNAGSRNYKTTEVDEVVTIERVSAGSASGERIRITMFGISQEYDNVASISANMGDGNDFMNIVGGVTLPVVAYLGADTDTLINNTGATVTAYGEGGRDNLRGGSGGDHLYGGADSDVIDGGAGADTVEGGAGNDFLVGGDGSDDIKGDEGQDLIAGDLGRNNGTASGTEFSSQASASGGADTIHGGTGADTIFGGSGGDTIYGDGDNDTMLGGDGKATLGATIVVAPLALGNDGADLFRWSVGDGNDSIDGQSGSDTLDLFGTDANQAFTLTANGAGFTAGVGTASLSVASVETSNAEGRGGQDTFAVNDLTGTSLTQINLKLGSDVVQDTVDIHGSSSGDVYSISTVSGALRVQKSGGATVDVQQVSSTSGGDKVTLHTAAGADVVNVLGTLAGTTTTVNGEAGTDTINVGSNAQGTAATPNNNCGGNLNGVTGALTVNGEVVNVDNSGDAASRSWTQTATTLTAGVAPPAVITYGGVAELNVHLGSGTDTYLVTDLADAATTSVDGGDPLNDTFTLDIAGDESGNLQVTHFENVTLDVGGDLSGDWVVSEPGDVAHINIGGDLTDAGSVKVTNVPEVNIGGDLAGVLTVTDKLGALRIGGDASGLIEAGDVDTIGVAQGTGPVVLRVVEAGVMRRVEAALPNNPYPNSKDADTPDELKFPGDVSFRLFYDSSDLTIPSLAARVTNPSGEEFDLSLVAYSNTAKFNLAGLDSVGPSHIRNVAVEGDLLAGVSSAMAEYMGYAPGTPGGVRLGQDALAGVAVRDYAPNGSIQAKSIQAVAFGSHTRNDGLPEAGAVAKANDAARLLVPGTATVPANDTFRVPFADVPAYQVGFFLVTDPRGGKFDSQNIALVVQALTTPNADLTANIVTPQNVDRGAATALITAVSTVARNGKIQRSAVQTIDFRGDGASMVSGQSIAVGITSTGPLGDLTFKTGPINNVTAPSIFGSVGGSGPIVGTIQTTGQRTDPITGVITSVPADLGRLFVTTTDLGAIEVATMVTAKGPGLSGRIIVRGNLISRVVVDGGLSGLVAVQGDIATTTAEDKYGNPVRLGGLVVNGGLSGRIVTLGTVYADVTVHGGLKGGRIAVKGDILGNLRIDGSLDPASAVVSGGKIGDTAAGTVMKVEEVKGILAAAGRIAFDHRPNTNQAAYFGSDLKTREATSAAAIEGIFMDNGTPLVFDLDLNGLGVILGKLAALHVSNGKLA